MTAVDMVLDSPAKTFVEVAEIWIPKDDRLVLSGGVYGAHARFAETSRAESFARGEGLPGKAWAEARPVILKDFDGSYFKRTEAAKEAGLTCAVAVPVFAGKSLKAVLVVLCADDAARTGAIEVWAEAQGVLTLTDGYYGAARKFEEVSRTTRFARGQGLPGAVWASQTPILMRDLGAGYRFLRSKSAAEAGLTNGLGLPIPVPGGESFVLTLLSAKGTPLARRFEIWDARAGTTARLVDGLCERDGPLWDPENAGREPVVNIWEGPVGRVLGLGIPVTETGAAAHGYAMMVALPIHRGGALSHVTVWYC